MNNYKQQVLQFFDRRTAYDQERLRHPREANLLNWLRDVETKPVGESNTTREGETIQTTVEKSSTLGTHTNASIKLTCSSPISSKETWKGIPTFGGSMHCSQQRLLH